MNLQPSLPQCPQCGKYHPPVNDGEDCPLKESSEAIQKGVDVNHFLSIMRKVLISNIETKDIQDLDKFQNYLIVKLTKEIENYKEE